MTVSHTLNLTNIIPLRAKLVLLTGTSVDTEVIEVEPAGIAQKAGVAKGMVLISVNAQSVVPDDSQASADQCMEIIGDALEALQVHMEFKRKV